MIKARYAIGFITSSITDGDRSFSLQKTEGDRQVFYPTPTLPLFRGRNKKFANDLGLLYFNPKPGKNTRDINGNAV
jgi:hypothetical protein